MCATRRRKTCLYDNDGSPKEQFNISVKNWLDGVEPVREHKPPAAFDGLRDAYNRAVAQLTEAGLSSRNAHRATLSRVTDLLFGHDLAAELQQRLAPGLINEGGFRSTLSQAFAKNVGENFVNLIVYALSDLFKDNEDVLIDKGLPPFLKEKMTLFRDVELASGTKEVRIPLEGDFSIFSRRDPANAIVISAKTRLKEVFHIGTMWKIFFDMVGDEASLEKWQLRTAPGADLSNILYLFATADLVNAEAARSQGGDVERDEPRNLIAMDASFFDYVLVSKTGIGHVSRTLNIDGPKEALFHELGCLIDLIEQKFNIPVPAEETTSPIPEPVARALEDIDEEMAESTPSVVAEVDSELDTLNPSLDE